MKESLTVRGDLQRLLSTHSRDLMIVAIPSGARSRKHDEVVPSPIDHCNDSAPPAWGRDTRDDMDADVIQWRQREQAMISSAK